MPGLVPGIHVFPLMAQRTWAQRTWMAGTKPGHDEKDEIGTDAF
jgi:hypothetical protein